MPDTQQILTYRFRSAVAEALGDEHASADPLIRPATNTRFGDYQANLAMGLGKKLGRPPREVAQHIVDHLATDGVCQKVEVAGPGFINVYLSDTFLGDQVAAMARDPDRLGVEPSTPSQKVVVDYSSPNVAKEMHVGHLRSTVIGDAIARVLAFQGHTVTRQNHIGDWGTQFGMLIQYMTETGWQTGSSQQIPDLNRWYRQAKAQFDADKSFADRARASVVKLQSGDQQHLALWRGLLEESKRHFNNVYRRIGVGLCDDDIRGESFYNAKLPGVIEGLGKVGLLQESRGATVVFPTGFTDRDGSPMPIIVRKSDGGYLYATTDLAAARFRIDELGADRLIYVTDARQNQHFAMVFATLRQAGWASAKIRLEHVPFGTVLGKDNKPFKTRAGETIRLVDLLDEAEKRAAGIIEQKNPTIGHDERRAIAHAVGIGALKYADLSNDRVKDYVFDWDRMLSFEGNTAPYLQNAYVRIRSIFRKGSVDPQTIAAGPIALDQQAERAVVVKLLQMPAVISAVGESLEPHRLCTYLYELASAYHGFYESCPVLTADAQTRDARLRLCELVARVLKKGLGLLGIDVIERM